MEFDYMRARRVAEMRAMLLIAGIAISSPSQAQQFPADVCKSVFENRVFNTVDESSQSTLRDSVFNEFCSNNQFTSSSIQSKAQSLGLDYGSLTESFGLDFQDKLVINDRELYQANTVEPATII